MNIRFGNLSAIQFEEKAEAELSMKDKKWIESHRTDKASFKEDDKLHIFNLPFGIVAGCDIGAELVERLKAYPFKHSFYVETKESED
jgi:hypothetical protein